MFSKLFASWILPELRVNPFPHMIILQHTTLNIFCQKIKNLSVTIFPKSRQLQRRQRATIWGKGQIKTMWITRVFFCNCQKVWTLLGFFQVVFWIDNHLHEGWLCTLVGKLQNVVDEIQPAIFPLDLRLITHWFTSNIIYTTILKLKTFKISRQH